MIVEVFDLPDELKILPIVSTADQPSDVRSNIGVEYFLFHYHWCKLR